MTSGQLYVISEHDLISGRSTPFRKIGLVRDGSMYDRDAERRVLEHQTGNPRQLVVSKTFAVQHVHMVERTLHKYFGMRRVHGEWFFFDDSSLPSLFTVIERVKDICDKITALEARVGQMEVSISGPDMIKPTPEALDAFTEFAATLERLTSVAEKGKRVKHAILERSDNEAYLKVSHVKMCTRFVASRVPEDIRGEFTSYVEEIHSKPRVLYTPSKQTHDIDLNALDLDELHDLHLHLVQSEAAVTLENRLAMLRLQAAVGANAGIEGLIDWPRSRRKVSRFDKDAFAAKYPDEYSAALVTRNASTRRTIRDHMIAATTPAAMATAYASIDAADVSCMRSDSA